MPNRSEALTALYAAQSKPKVALPPEDIPTPTMSGMVGQHGAVLRVRDCATIAAQTKPKPTPQTPQDANAAAWAEYEESWRKRLGGYVKL